MLTTLRQEYALFLGGLYKDYGQKRVLENINLAVRTGELVAVVGPSGCGKSTLLRLILGEEYQTAGSILVFGNHVCGPSPERGIVYQKYSLLPNLTVLGNIMLGEQLPLLPWQSWRKRKIIKKEALEYLEKVNLIEHADKYPHQLSGGMQQRVAIAQALIKEPKILLMDEPFSGLDPGTRESMQVLLLKLWKEHGMTIFFVTHNLEEAAYLGTRIIALSQFYSANHKNGDSKKGSRVVCDYQLERTAASTTVKATAEFGQLILQIRREAFDPQYLQMIDEFNLKHPDSFSRPDKDEQEIEQEARDEES